MSAHHGAGQSHVGHAAFYEAGDQRNEPRSVANERDRYKEGQYGSHQNMNSKDERSIANKLASEEHHHGGHSHKHHGVDYDAEGELSKIDPRRPAELHGHEPSKGAKVDKELQEDDKERMAQKGL